MNKSVFILLCALVGCCGFPALSQETLPVMIRVDAGEFQMGDVRGTGDNDELPVRLVKLNDYYIAKTEITVAQWRVFCLETSQPMPAPPSWGWLDDHPIVNVSWQESVDYCSWLSTKLQRVIRLPTEAEWEFAAKGGTRSKTYPFSGGTDLNQVGFYDILSPTQTQPVQGKLANELGLFDMSGNVWEWCADWYADGYPAQSPVSNPRGATTGVRKIIRGGGWVAPAADLRVTNRWRELPETRTNYLGFRPVME